MTVNYSMGFSCVLMFSGGRDSTVASIRLANQGYRLILVTVTSDHLEGISAVENRLIELKRHLPQDTLWALMSDHPVTSPNLCLAQRTCLPCFLKYTSLGVIVARMFKVPSLAFGFTKYQSTWPEQTPFAVEGFRRVLASFDIALELPVYDVVTKAEILKELGAFGLNTLSLEQKCTRQITNQEIPGHLIESATDEWSSALFASVSSNLSLDPSFMVMKQLHEIETYGSAQQTAIRKPR